MARRGLRRYWFPIALTAVVFVLLAPIQAQAAFQVTTAASTAVGTATLSPASSPGVQADGTTCGLVVLVAPTMRITWSVTPSPFATGYQITPVLNTVAQSPVTVNGRATTSQSISVIRNTLSVTNSYQFRIQAVVGNWTSSTVTTSSASCPLLL